nr:serine hydrolase [Leucobacter weissii]
MADSIDEAIAEAMELSGSTAAVVGVWQGDEAAYVQGFGDGVTANSAIRSAQATQPAMCALLLDLVDSGQLTLDREVSEDLSRQVGIEGITYGQLCTATSGLSDFKTGISDIFANNPTRPWADRELLSQALARSPLSWPGLDVHLADTNTLLLGRALRAVTNTSLPELLESRVFSRAGMDATFYPRDPLGETTLPDGGLTGQTQPFSGRKPVCDVDPVAVPEVSPSMLAGAGATVSTVTDIKDFYAHYLGGTFGGESAGLITETVSTTNPVRNKKGETVTEGAKAEEALAEAEDPGGQKWGFGLERVESLYGMSGAMTGTLTAAYRDPGTGVAVVVALNNSSAGSRFVRHLAFQLAALGGAEVSWTAEQRGKNLARAAVC